MITNLQKNIDHFLQTATDNYIKDKKVEPVVFFITDQFILQHKKDKTKPNIGVMPAIFETSEEKHAFFSFLGIQIRAGKMNNDTTNTNPAILEEILFISEAWYKSANKNDKLDPNKRPSEYSDRQEAILTMYRNKDGTVIIRGKEIIKKDNKITFKDIFNKSNDKPDSMQDNLLVNAFNPDPFLLEQLKNNKPQQPINHNIN